MSTHFSADFLRINRNSRFSFLAWPMLDKHPFYTNCKIIRKLGKSVQTSPTIGSNFEQISLGNVELAAHDLGGQDSL